MALQEKAREALDHAAQPSTTFEIAGGANAGFATSMAVKAIDLIDKGKLGDAEKCVRAGLQRCPDHPGCLCGLAVCLAVGERNFKAAERIARQVIDADADNGRAYYVLGRVNLEGRRRKFAFRHFERSRAVAPDDTALAKHLDRMEPRRSPVIGFLPRDHFLNYALGWLRARVFPARTGH